MHVVWAIRSRQVTQPGHRSVWHAAIDREREKEREACFPNSGELTEKKASLNACRDVEYPGRSHTLALSSYPV